MNHHKATLFFLLVFLFPLISPIVPAPPGGSQSAASSPATSLSLQPPAAAQAPVPPPPEGPVKVGGEYRYESAGTQLSTTEYSQGTNSSLTVTNLDYGATKDGMVRLPAGWTGYRMVADVGSFYSRLFFIHNVSDGEGPVRENGDFTSVGSEWSNQYSMGSYTNYTGSNPNWGYWWSSVGGKSGNGVRLYLKWDNGIQWQNTYYNSMYNTINIPWENPITFARLSFYARVNYAGNNNARGRLVIYVEVASKVYRLLLEDKCPTDNTWYLVTVEIPDYDLATWNMPGNIGVRIGLSWTGTQDSWDQETWYLDIDGANLEVRGLAQPFDSSWVALRMNATTNYDTSKPYGYGYATYTMSGTWPNPTTLHRAVVARWTTTDTDSRNVDFIYNLTLYVTKTGTTRLQGGALGSTFSARNSSSTVYWKTYFNAQEPTYFRAYNLTINKPGTETWTKYQVWDPTPTDRTSAVTEYANRLELPNAAVNDMFGWWNFTFTSTNRVSSITTNAQTYRVAPGSPSSITVTATLISGTTSGEANLTIYRPDGLVLAGSEQVVAVTGTTVNFAAVSLPTGATAPAGQYTVCVTYDDDTSHDGTCTATRAGFRSKTVTVQHATNVWGDPASLQVVYGSGYFYPRVRYNDTDTSTFIEGATVTGNWTAATAFYQSGGFYEVQFDASGKVPGDYVIQVDASKTYYDSDLCYITVQVRGQSSLTCPQSPGVTKPYSEVFTVQVKYADGGGAGITGATVTTDWPGNPSGVANGTAGWYNIAINTTRQSSPGTYSLTITAQKSYYQTQVLTLTIVVRERNTLMTATSPATVPFDELSKFTVSLSDLDAAGAAITNSTSKLHLSVWYSGTRWDSIGRATITQWVAGTYNITVSTSFLGSEGSYAFEVRFQWWGSPDNKPFYAERTVTVYVGVRKITTAITYNPVPQTPWDQNIPITFYYKVDDVGSQYNGQGITSATFTIRLDSVLLTQGTDYTLTNQGSGQYLLTLLSSSGKISTIKTYSLDIQGVPSNAKYNSATRTLSFAVRALKTTITYNPPLPVPWGNNVVITFNYTVDDTESSSHNGEGIAGVTSIAGSTLDGTALTGGQYTLVDNGQGRYTLTILYSSGRISLVKSYSLALHVVSPSSHYQDANRQVTFSVRRLITQATYDPPTPTPRGDNVIIVFYYKVNDPESAQHNAGVTGVTSITGTTLEGSPLTQGTDYTLVDNGAGKYTLTLLFSSGKISTIKLYTLQLHVVSPDAYHDAADRTITFNVRTISTRISYVPLVPLPRGTDIVISFNYTVNDPASSQNNQGITGVTSIAGSTLDGTPLTGSDYQLTWVSGGKYTLTIRYSSGKISTIKSYTLALHVVSPDAYHDAADQTIPFDVRKIRTAAFYDAVGSIAWGQDVVITFYFRVDDSASSENGNGITGVTSIAGTTLDGTPLTGSDYVLASQGAGKYTLTIRYSSGKISTVKAYSLSLHVVSPDAYHEDAVQAIGFSIRVHVITCNVDAIPRIPYQNFLTFTLRINDSDLSQPLPDKRLSGLKVIGFTTVYFGPNNWTAGVTNGTAGSGIYYVTIDTRTWPVQTHSLTINVYPTPSYANGAVYASAVVRKLAIAFVRDATPTVPWDEDGNVNATYSVSDAGALQDGSLLPGATISITRLGVPLVRYTDFNYFDLGSGRYMIVFYRSILGNPGTKTFNVTIHLDAQHDDGTLQNVPITVRKLLTWLHPISVPQTPYGDNVYIKVAFEVLDAQSTRHNGQFIQTADIRVNASSWVKGTQYIVQWLAGEQVYNITIYQSYVSQIRWYKIQVDATNPGVMYEVASIPRLDFQVRTAATALAVAAPDPQPWGNTFNFTVTFTINDPDTIRNGQGINGYAINMTLVGYSKPSQYTVTGLGGGQYRFVLNSSAVNIPGGPYTITINTVWTVSPPPYAAQTKQFQVLITNRLTDTPNSPGVEFGYADFIIANFTYVDLARSSSRILNTSYEVGNVLVKVYWKHPVHTGGVFLTLNDQLWNTTAMTGQPYAFKLTIKADFWGYVDTYYDFNVSITWKAGTAPYFSGGAFSFRAYVVGQRTNLTLQPTQGATPYGQIMNFTVVYLTQQGNAITNQTPNSYVHFRMLCPKVPGLSYGTGWWVNYIGAGSYAIHVRTTALGAIDTYLFYLNVTYDNLPNPTPSPYYQSQYNVPIIQTVREIDTLLNYQSPGTVYYGENVRFLAEYWDQDNGIHVPGSPTVKAYWDNGTEIIGAVIFRYSSGPHQYWYNITIPTAGVLAGRYVRFEIRASNTYYVSKVQSLEVYINLLPLGVQLLTPAVIEKYYGEQPYPRVNVTVTDVYGSRVTDATVTGIAEFGSFPLTHVGNGIYWSPIYTEHDRDRYPIEIRASRTGQYANSSVYITITITAGPSILIPYPTGSPTSFVVYAGDQYLIIVNYTTAAGVPLIGASVTYTCADPKIPTGILSEIQPGIYRGNFSSTDLLTVIYTIAVKASLGGNVQSQSLTFSIDVRYTPIELTPQSGIYLISTNYLDNFTIMVYANNTRIPSSAIPQPGLTIKASWQGLPAPVTLQDLGGGWYTFEFPATLAAGFSYPLHLDLTGSYSSRRLTLNIQIAERVTKAIAINNALAVNSTWNKPLTAAMQIPVGDWLYIYFMYEDKDNLLIANGSGLASIDAQSMPGLIIYDETTGYYLLRLYIDPDFPTTAFGTHSLKATLGKPNYISQVFAATFTVVRIPMDLRLDDVVGYQLNATDTYTVYIGAVFDIKVLLWDTWHDQGVEGANLTLPAWWTAPSGVTWEELGGGYYLIHGRRNALGEVVMELAVTATKEQPLKYQPTSMGKTVVLDFKYSPQFILVTWGGSAAAVILVVLLVSWLLWIRVFSIPWEVRRMRTLAKKVNRDQTFELSGKDRKHFRDRPVAVEDTVGKAMTTIGVPVTAAMLPTTTEVAEVSATEEDLMGELDKIPGLGAEEKAVLAQEMRKIPRKDRIWFLDDLRRQMGERRMDFLTTKTPTPAPAPTVRAEAAAKPALVEAPKPVTPAKPGKPKEKVEKAAKPEKPKERVAPTVRPREEHVAPPPTDAVEVEIRRELDKIPGLTADEKSALLEHLKYLTPEERRATYQSLRQTADK